MLFRVYVLPGDKRSPAQWAKDFSLGCAHASGLQEDDSLYETVLYGLKYSVFAAPTYQTVSKPN